MRGYPGHEEYQRGLSFLPAAMLFSVGVVEPKSEQQQDEEDDVCRNGQRVDQVDADYDAGTYAAVRAHCGAAR